MKKAKILLEQTEIGDGCRKFELGVFSGGHCEVNRDKSGGEDEEDGEKHDQLPT